MRGILGSVKEIKKSNVLVGGFAALVPLLIFLSLHFSRGVLPSTSHSLLCGPLCSVGSRC